MRKALIAGMCWLFLLGIVLTNITLAQNLPENHPNNEAFVQEFVQIQNQILERGDNPYELPVGYVFTRPNGERINLDDRDRQFGAWGRLFRHPDHYGIPYEMYEENPSTLDNPLAVASSGAQNESRAASSVPWWIITLIGVTLLFTIGLFILLAWHMNVGTKRTDKRFEELNANMRDIIREEIARLQPITDEDDTFTDRPFRLPTTEQTPAQVYNDMQELTREHLGAGWRIDRNTIEHGRIVADNLSMFRYNPHGSQVERDELGRVNVTGYRAAARRGEGEEREEQVVYALAPCMNFAVPNENGNFEFIAEEQVDVDPLIGTVAEVVEVNRAGNGGTMELTLRHPAFEATLTGYVQQSEDEPIE